MHTLLRDICLRVSSFLGVALSVCRLFSCCIAGLALWLENPFDLALPTCMPCTVHPLSHCLGQWQELDSMCRT